MRKALLTAGPAFVLVAGAAAAHGPFDGRWGFDVDACAVERGTSDMVPTEIHAPEIRYYESTCLIDDLVAIGGDSASAWRVQISCGGEGETWTTDAIFAVDHGGGERRPQLIEIDMETGSVVVRQFCDWPSGTE